jgi:ATP-dependent DNA helicase RecQ
METLFRYVEANQCRMKSLVNYFGEFSVPACGICDDCLSRKEISEEMKKQFIQINETIKKSLTETPQDIQTLVASYHGVLREAFLQRLHDWLDEGILFEKDGLLYLKNRK